MASILFVVTHCTDNPFKAVTPFEMAAVASDSGHEVQIAILGDGAFLLNDSVAGGIQGLGTKPFKEALDKVVEREIPIFICGTCATKRGISDGDLKGKNASYMSKDVFVELVAGCDRVVSF